MKELMSFLGCIFLFWAIAFGIGVLRTYKQYKVLMLPTKKYFSNLFKSMSVVFYAMGGKTVPDTFKFVMDSSYAKLSIEQIRECLEHARKKMIEIGCTTNKYKVDVFDCDNYAMTFHCLCSLYLRDHFYPAVSGAAPFFLFGYTKSNGRTHVCLQAIDKNSKSYFFEVYPEDSFFKELKLTPQEVSSCNLSF